MQYLLEITTKGPQVKELGPHVVELNRTIDEQQEEIRELKNKLMKIQGIAVAEEEKEDGNEDGFAELFDMRILYGPAFSMPGELARQQQGGWREGERPSAGVQTDNSARTGRAKERRTERAGLPIEGSAKAHVYCGCADWAIGE